MDFENIPLNKKEALLKQLGKMYRVNRYDLKQGFFIEESSKRYEYVKVQVRVDDALKMMERKKANYIRDIYLNKNGIDTLDENEKNQIIDVFLHCLYG